MTARFAHIQRMAELYRMVLHNPAEAPRYCRIALLKSLPDQHRKLYDWISRTYTGKVTSAIVSREFDYNQNHASGLLNELWQWGLLNRQKATDENGKYYLYEINNQVS